MRQTRTAIASWLFPVRRARLLAWAAFLGVPASADPIRPGDWNQDGQITQADMAALSGCLTGPDSSPTPACGTYDMDADGDVDLRDYRGLQFALMHDERAGDWNSDGFVWLDDFAAAATCTAGPDQPVSPSCAFFDLDGDDDIDLADLGKLQKTVALCGLLESELEPVDWLDTGANNSMQPANSLFRLRCVDGRPALSTSSSLTNIHSHYIGTGSDDWAGYVYTGRMRISDSQAGVGVTFYSDYPNSDNYYRMRRYGGAPSFRITAHTTTQASLSGECDTGVIPLSDVWYAFHIEVKNTLAQTVIRAKVWPDGGPPPPGWLAECVDNSAQRHTEGTIGVWSMDSGARDWGRLHAGIIPCDTDSDGDGTLDCHDACPENRFKIVPGACGCDVQDLDADFDGVPNCLDQCPGAPDTDSDADGTPNCSDGCPNDPGKISPGVCGCGIADTDSDGDGTPDCFDAADLCLTTRELNFGSVMTMQGLEVWNCGGGTVNYAITSKPSWISFSPSSGSSSGERDLLWASVNRPILGAGRHTGTVVLSNTQTNRQIWITATVNKTVLTPIARWDVVPRQRINLGETLNCGVVAFSKAGINRVRFAISGQGYTGPATIDVTSMTFNPQTSVWEYWTPIHAADFQSDGIITVSATVIGKDGGVRDANTLPGKGLEPLELFVNRFGTLPANTAWVAVNGNDATGAVNNPARPFARMSIAMQALAAYQGGKADGGVVRLRPGNHEADGGGIFGGETAVTQHEWITITHDPAAGGNPANTVIDRRGSGDLTSMWLKVCGLTLSAPEIINGGSSTDPDRDKRSVWLKDCTIIGNLVSDRPFPVGSGWRGPHYYTECYITNQRRASGNGQNHRIMRNLTIINTREDIFQAVPMGVNIYVAGVDPGDGPDPEHADVIQSPGAVKGNAVGMHNWVFYNVVATDLHYQALFSRTGAPAMDNAFVNCLFEMRTPVRPGGVGTALGGMYDHLLLWHCTFIGTGTTHKAVVGRTEIETFPSNSWLLGNLSVRGCLIDRYTCEVGSSLFNQPYIEFRDNHYITPVGTTNTYNPDTVGGTISVGNPMIITNTSAPDFGGPAAGSILLNRITPPFIPADAYGVPHGATADVGALAR